MALNELRVRGLRGFSTRQTLPLAIPNGAPGSGLTMIVGPNNGGKSTLIEALRAVAHPGPTFTEGKRNKIGGDRVEIRVTDDNGRVHELRTVSAGGSETEWSRGSGLPTVLALPSRRHFSPFFSGSAMDRGHYARQFEPAGSRSVPLSYFSHRLFRVVKNRAAFDAVLSRVLDPVPDWTIDQVESGQHYLKIKTGDHYHNSDGLGEGMVSLFTIVDALYDSAEGEVIAVDEPELSLHPSLQRKLSALFRDYSATRQIVCATHSPYFVDMQAILAGGLVVRAHQTEDGTVVDVLSDDSRNWIGGAISNLNNPHILGLDACEVFFLNDGVILVEGQEDVVCYQRFADQVGIAMTGEFFGWGVGGAGNMPAVARILQELGFRRVVGVLDGDQTQMVEDLAVSFPEYRFFAIPTDDVRSKRQVPQRSAVSGLADSSGNLRSEYADGVRCLFQKINAALLSN